MTSRATDADRRWIHNVAVRGGIAAGIAGAGLGCAWQAPQHGWGTAALAFAAMAVPLAAILAVFEWMHARGDSPLARFLDSRDDEGDSALVMPAAAWAGAATYATACLAGVFAATGALPVVTYVAILATGGPIAFAAAYVIRAKERQ